MENMRSSLVWVKYLRLTIKLRYVVGFTLKCDSFTNLHRFSSGICARFHSNTPLCYHLLVEISSGKLACSLVEGSPSLMFHSSQLSLTLLP